MRVRVTVKVFFIGSWSIDSHDIRSRRGWRREILYSLLFVGGEVVISKSRLWYSALVRRKAGFND